MTKQHALRLRTLITKASASLADAEALEAQELFPFWQGNSSRYAAGDRARHMGRLWRCLQDHLSQPGWEPGAAPSLWAQVLIPDPAQIPDWEQPDSTNAYQKGDRVRHQDKIWISDLDGNIWEPGIYGWTEIIE